MKPKFRSLYVSVGFAAGMILTSVHSLSAADFYWDVNGATVGTGGAGSWTVTNTWRDGSAAGTLGNWVDGNVAFLGGTAGAVTISSGTTITTPKIVVQSGNYSLSGGTVAFGGSALSPGIIDVTTSSGFSFSSGATGHLRLNATGNTTSLANSAQIIITGSTNLSSVDLALHQDQNHVILGNAAALGSSTSTVKLSKGTLNLGNTSGVNLSYNSWATDLAGGTIRARFALQTWNGATTVSANSQLMTRNAADAKLIFSSTGTIDLASTNSLTLMASSSSQGIELNGVISGTGNLVTGSNPLGGSDNGNGVTTLNAANTFTGSATTTQNIGTIALGNVNALQNATLNTGLSGTQAVTFVVAGSNTYNIGAITGSDALAIGGNTISVGNKSGTYSFGADISGSGGLTKTGANSTQTLTAATSYTGATSITGGTLAFTGAGAVNSSSGISINGTGAKLLHNGSSAIAPVVTVTNGILTGNGTVNSVVLSDSANASISNNDGVAGTALTVGTLSLQGAGNINLFSNSTSAALVVTSSLSTGSTAATITANNTGGWSNGSTYQMISYAGGSIGGSGFNFNQVVNNLSARQNATWQDTGSAIQFTVNGDKPRWMGDTDGKWNLTTANNWKLVTGETYTNFLATDDVLFDDNATGVTTIDIDAADVATNTVVFNNSSKDYSLTGAFGIAAGSLTKNGTGTLTISTNNSYAGTTNLNAGAVVLSGSGTLGSSSALTMAGASLDLGGTSQNMGAVSITHAASSGSTLANGSITGTSYSISNSSGNAVIGANLLANGAAGLTKSGAGTATLAGNNTWTGTTLIQDGALAISGSGTLGNSALSLAGGSLELGGTSQTVGTVTISNAAASGDTLSNGSLTGTSYSTSHSSGNVAISANLLVNGSAGFTMSGGGNVTLSGANTYTGSTAVSAGTLFVGSSSAFTDKGSLALSGSSTFDLAGFNAGIRNLSGISTNTITTSGTGTGTDTLTISALTASTGVLLTDGASRKLAVSINGTPAIDPLSNANNTFSGGLNLTNMRLSVVDNSAITGGRYGRGTITINAGSQFYYNAANRTVSNDIVVNANSTVGSRVGAFRVDTTGNVLSGTITAAGADAMFNAGGGNGGITLTGRVTGASGLQVRNTNGSSITLTLNNANSDNDYSGGTSVGESTARLVLGGSHQIPNGIGKGNVSLTGTLDLAGFNDTINGLSGAGILEGAIVGTGSNTFTLGDGNATNTNFSGIIQNTAGTLGITKIGTGTQILSGANTYAGATLISAGTLQIGNAGTTGSLSTSSIITTDGTITFNRTDTMTQGVHFANGILGSGSLSMMGTGTLVLSGTNSYSGATNVSNGELRITSATAINQTSGIIVNSGRFSLDGGITAGLGKTITVNGSGGNFFGSLQGSSGNNVWEGSVVIGSTAGTRIGVNAGSLKITGEISGSTAGNGVLLRPNTGTVLEISGQNSYLGDTTIISGTGEVVLSGGNNRLPTGTRVVFGGSGTSGILNLNGQSQEIAGLSVASGTANEVKSATAATLTVRAAASSSYSGLLSGQISLVKTGAERLTLSGTNGYSGTTTISEGTLALSGTGSIANSSRIDLAASTTLDITGRTGGFTLEAAQTMSGSGTILATGSTVTAAGTLSPGNSPGILVQDGGVLVLGAGGNMNWQIYDATGSAGTGYDSVSLINGATLDLASLTTANPYLINLWSLSAINPDANGNALNFDPNQSYSWTLFSTGSEILGFDENLFMVNVGANNGTSGFANALNGGAFSVVLGDSNTDLVLQFTAVPETSVSLLGGLSALLLLRRKRR